MTLDPNKVAALLRQQNDRISELEKSLKESKREQGYISFKEKTLRDALKATPNFYVWEINFAAGATQRTPVTLQTDPRGYFFAERIWMSWRPTGVGPAAPNTWNSISSDNPHLIAATMFGGGAPNPDGIDFYWEYSEGSSSLMRMNAAVPGTVLYRGDMDGCIPGSDGWAPSTTVTFFITPLGAAGTPWAGVFNITVAGSQAYQTLM